MSGDTSAEDRLLDKSELEMVSATRSPAIEQKSKEELKALVHRLRHAHSRAQDIGSRQRREIRGKADPRGAKPATDNAGTIGKAQVLFEAIRRADAELSRREEEETGKPSPSEFARRALEMKMASEAPSHPGAGRTASKGMKPKARVEEFSGGTTRKEVGRVSQAGKVAQARKDSGNV